VGVEFLVYLFKPRDSSRGFVFGRMYVFVCLYVCNFVSLLVSVVKYLNT